MKLIHLSDLHIGKRLNEISLLEDQEYILTQILRIIDEEKADAVMISGDVYDKSIPSAEAVVVFDDFLCRLAKRQLPVFIISGNHDSAERLSFGNRLFEISGVHISPAYNGKVSPITLSDGHGEVNIYMLPFVKPSHVRRFYPDAGIESYTDACRTAVEEMHVDAAKRNVLLTHQFVTGATTCESEEISVGGSDNVDASVFEVFDYVALGHIHGPQNIGSNKIRYCGTPLKYSFSEEKHNKSVTVVNLNAKGDLKVELRPLTPRHDLRSICGTFAEVTDKSFYEGTAVDDYLRVILTDEEDVPEVVGKLRTVYENIMEVKYDNTRTRETQAIGGAENVQSKSPLELFEELYEKQNNQPMSDEQRSFAQELIDLIREEDMA